MQITSLYVHGSGYSLTHTHTLADRQLLTDHTKISSAIDELK